MLGRDWMGDLAEQFVVNFKHLILGNEIIDLMFKRNSENRTRKVSQFLRNHVTKNLILTFFNFFWEIVDFSWKRLLIVLITCFNHPVGWHPFFDIFSLSERRPDTILDRLWFLFEPSLGLAMLRLIFLLMDHSDTYNSAFRNRTHLIFFIFPIAGAIYVVIIIL